METATLTELPVEVEQPLMITPAEATPITTLFLCNIDQEAMYKVETVNFFAANPDTGNLGKLVDVIREAISKVLVPYYFLAGRFKPNVTEQRLDLDCNAAGVLFASATCELTIADLGDVSIPNPIYRKLILQPSETLGLFGTPLVTFQVTKFRCGGFTFGMTNFHSLMDGVSITDFLRNLGLIARGQDVQIIPNPSREFLRARSPLQPKRYEDSMSSIFRVSKFGDIQLLPFNPTLTNINNSAPELHVFKTFPFSSQMLAALKGLALKDGSLSNCSTFEALAAHVWREVVRSKGLDRNSFATLFIAVDFRRKMIPLPPREFCGNAVCTSCLGGTVGEMLDMSLTALTASVRAALNDIDDEYVRSWTDFWEIHRVGPARFPMGGCLSGWWKLPFYDLDFGWGKPIYAGPVPNQLVNFILLLSNGQGDGGANLYLSLEPNQMAAFESSIYTIFQDKNFVISTEQ